MKVYSFQYKQAVNCFGKQRVALFGKVGGMEDDVVLSPSSSPCTTARARRCTRQRRRRCSVRCFAVQKRVESSASGGPQGYTVTLVLRVCNTSVTVYPCGPRTKAVAMGACLHLIPWKWGIGPGGNHGEH
jgi:hypothetical protein